VTSITSLAATLPTFLLQAKYSRAFETEADDFALAQLAARGIPHEAFASILERMERASSTAPEALKYLSTHPSTRERAARARAR
jgi:predicted Zn-dependent protease